MNNILGIIALAISAIVGAGFASGKEINIFFNNTGIYGMLNIFLAIILFFITFYYVFTLINTYHITRFNQLVKTISNEKVANISEHIMSVFLLIIFWIMLAGFGAYLSQLFNISSVIGAIILSIACYISFQFNIDGIIRISKYVLPIIILGITLLIFNTEISYTISPLPNTPTFTSITSGIIYASYNLVIAIPIMITARQVNA